MPGAVPVTASVDFVFAASVSFTRTERVNDAPGVTIGSFCTSGLTRTPLAAFTRSEPWAVAVAPVLVTLMGTVFHVPALTFSGLALAIESTGGAGIGAGAGVEAGAG